MSGQPEQLALLSCPAIDPALVANIRVDVDELDQADDVGQLDLLCLVAAVDVAAASGIEFRRLTDTAVDGAELAARMDAVSALLWRQMRERERSAS